MAFGANPGNTVVGTDGNGNAFALSHGKLKTFTANVPHVRDCVRDQ